MNLSIRVATSDYVILVYDAGFDADGSLFFSYLLDRQSQSLATYDHPISSRIDVGRALTALTQQFGVVLDEFLVFAPELADDIAAAAADSGQLGAWITPTRRELAQRMATNATPEELASIPDDEISTQVVECNPCTFSVDPGRSRGPGMSVPVRPREGMTANEFIDVTIQALACPPCGGGGGPPGGGDPCSGVNCDDGNLCTTDSCSDGACVNVPLPDPCCDGSVAGTLANMELDLGSLVETENLLVDSKLGEPVVNLTGTGAIAPLVILADGVQVRGGSVAVGCGVGGVSANLVIGVNNGETAGSGLARSWTLTQSVVASGGAITMWGDITVIDETTGTTTLVGGWTWSAASGPQINPASDAEFMAAVAEMLNLTTGSGGSAAAAAAGFDIGTILTWLANVTKLLTNYIRDWFIPYTPPTSCTGPIVEDGAGQSCENVDIPCKDDLADVCLSIDDIPGVSTAFKKCMKGRCGCGGSSFNPARITCGETNACGPCTPLSGEFVVIGCNLVGSQVWYCPLASFDNCDCANTMLHEMGHACGAVDVPIGSPCPDPGGILPLSCVIGEWGEDELCGPPAE